MRKIAEARQRRQQQHLHQAISQQQRSPVPSALVEQVPINSSVQARPQFITVSPEPMNTQAPVPVAARLDQPTHHANFGPTQLGAVDSGKSIPVSLQSTNATNAHETAFGPVSVSGAVAHTNLVPSPMTPADPRSRMDSSAKKTPIVVTPPTKFVTLGPNN